MGDDKKWTRLGVILGGICIVLSIGSIQTFGNMNPYVTSYMRLNGTAPGLTYTECSWVFAAQSIGLGLGSFLGGLMAQKIGVRRAALVGSTLMSLGMFLSYLTIKCSFLTLLLTYGVVFGLGMGNVYTLPVACAMKWVPEKPGLVSGVIMGASGFGAFIFDQVQKAFVNPYSIEATLVVDEDTYFDNVEVLNNVPNVFLLLGGCFAGLLYPGSLLLRDVPSKSQEMKNLQEGEYKDLLVNSEDDDDHDEYELDKNGNTTRNLSPKEVLKTKDFYMIFVMFVCIGEGSVFMFTLYKAFGLTFIDDDAFLSWTGSFAALCNGIGRIFWGTLADKFSYKMASVLMSGSFACLLLTFQLVKLEGKILYFIYVCLLYAVFGGTFSLTPLAVGKCFGTKHMSANHGLIMTAEMVFAPLSILLSRSFLSTLGWSGLFFMTAGMSSVTLILSLLFNAKDNQGREI